MSFKLITKIVYKEMWDVRTIKSSCITRPISEQMYEKKIHSKNMLPWYGSKKLTQKVPTFAKKVTYEYFGDRRRTQH